MAFMFEYPGQMQELNSEMPIDRISSLPDDLLINILNFLPTKYAFITSMLSRRWSYLFKEVTHLDLDDSLLFNSPGAFNHEKSCVSFRDFALKMLDCLKLSNLISFRFKCSVGREQLLYKNIGLSLDAILSRGIQEIDLDINSHVVLPHSIFTCQTLCILKLTVSGTATGTIVAIPDTLCLPCLEILHLNLSRVFDVHKN
ncbi:F-box/LRR-repeat protein At4g14103-like [Silene latifolia]|uniref:F-box/LRR-repeat protein At4g14103-like n=1 Tax=Silene latifolia TaxID=37657 RepID=UPI003D76A4CC